jgi:hypothetical protein
MGRKVPFWCSVRLQGRLLLPFSDSLGKVILRSSPSEIASRHTKIRHLAYVLGSSSLVQSDQSLSRAPFEPPPSKEQPGFSVVWALLLCDNVSYTKDHKPIDVYIKNMVIIPLTHVQRRAGTVPYRA